MTDSQKKQKIKGLSEIEMLRSFMSAPELKYTWTPQQLNEIMDSLQYFTALENDTKYCGKIFNLVLHEFSRIIFDLIPVLHGYQLEGDINEVNLYVDNPWEEESDKVFSEIYLLHKDFLRKFPDVYFDAENLLMAKNSNQEAKDI